MPIIEESEALARVNSPNNLLNLLEVKKLHNGGRREGDKNLPPMVREIAAISARIDGPTKAAVEFGISRTHANRLSTGIVTHADGVDLEFKNKIDSKVQTLEEEAHESALNKLLTTLDIVGAKAADIKNAKTASKVASDMARVVNVLRPKGPLEGANINGGAKIVIYAPQQKHVATYKTVEV
jgi:hypothetical protein